MPSRPKVRAAERALAHVLLDVSFDAAFVTDRGVILDVNPLACSLLERSEEEVLGHELDAFVRRAGHTEEPTPCSCGGGHVHDAPGLLADRPDRSVRIRSVECAGLVVTLVRATDSDGMTAHPTLAEAGALPGPGSSEQAPSYRQLVEALAHGVQVCDRGGRVIYVNDGYRRMYGIPSGETPEHIADMLETDADRAGLLRYLEELATQQPDPTPYLARNRTADGRLIDVQVDWRYNRDETGRVVGFSSIVMDITDRRRQEGALERTLAEQQLLLRGIKHRVRNNLQLLASVLGLSAASLPPGRTLDEFVADAERRIQSMAVAHDALWQDVTERGVCFSAYAESLLRWIRDTQLGERLDIRIDSVVGDVWLDPEDAIPLGLVLCEALTNAIKHAFPADRPGRIEVTLTQTAQGLELRVRDDGVGLPPASTSARQGFGLELMSLLTEQARGQIEIEGSTGTQVLVRVPPSRVAAGAVDSRDPELG